MRLILALILLAVDSRADVLTLTLDQPNLSVTAGVSVEFSGSLSNPGATDIFLNGDEISLNQSLFVDDSPFFTFAPLFLSPGQTYTGPFFNVFAGLNATPGLYSGSFSVDGGADANARSAEELSAGQVEMGFMEWVHECFSIMLSLANPLNHRVTEITERKKHNIEKQRPSISGRKSFCSPFSGFLNIMFFPLCDLCDSVVKT